MLLDALGSDGEGSHVAAHVARVGAKLDKLEALGLIGREGLHAHLRLASVAAKAELDDGTAARGDESAGFVDFELEQDRKVGHEGVDVDEKLAPRNEENARLAVFRRVRGRLDPVEGDFDAMAAQDEGSDGGTGEHAMRGLGAEEDKLGGRRVVLGKVGAVDVRGKHAADAADGTEQLANRHIVRKVGQPQPARLLGRQVLGGCVGLAVHTKVARREVVLLGRARREVAALAAGLRDSNHRDKAAPLLACRRRCGGLHGCAECALVEAGSARSRLAVASSRTRRLVRIPNTKRLLGCALNRTSLLRCPLKAMHLLRCASKSARCLGCTLSDARRSALRLAAARLRCLSRKDGSLPKSCGF